MATDWITGTELADRVEIKARVLTHQPNMGEGIMVFGTTMHDNKPIRTNVIVEMWPLMWTVDKPMSMWWLIKTLSGSYYAVMQSKI